MAARNASGARCAKSGSWGIAKLIEAGATTIASATCALLDKRTMMRRIGEEIMPHFRS